LFLINQEVKSLEMCVVVQELEFAINCAI